MGNSRLPKFSNWSHPAIARELYYCCCSPVSLGKKPWREDKRIYYFVSVVVVISLKSSYKNHSGLGVSLLTAVICSLTMAPSVSPLKWTGAGKCGVSGRSAAQNASIYGSENAQPLPRETGANSAKV